METAVQSLEPLPYHVALRDYLKTNEPDLWKWFSSAKAQEDYTASLRLDLLKRTYRLEPTMHGDLYRDADAVKTKLGLDVPVTIYQSQQSQQLNAAIFFIPGEAHVVIEGQVLSLLNPHELRALLGHELAHYRLWSGHDGEFLIVDRILQSVAQDMRAEPSHYQSARRIQLYTEIYADRGALSVTNDVDVVVSTLVKMNTGLAQVSAQSYIQQAGEIFSQANVTTEGMSHPEAFIRARALALWAAGEESVNAEIHRMIEGPLALDELDLIGQQKLTALTRRFLSVYLKPWWFQTETILGQARLFFADFQPAAETHTDDLLFDELSRADAKTKDYLCYLLLDFAAVDPELDQVPLASAFVTAERLGVGERLYELANRELKIGKRELTKIQRDAAETLERAIRQAEDES